MFARKCVALVAGLGLAACGPKVASIDVEPSSKTLVQKGQAAELVATPKDAEGKAIANLALTWSSSDPEVAVVDAVTGKVTAVKTGDTVLKVAFQDKAVKEVPVQVSLPASISVAPSEVTLDRVGASSKITARVLDEKGRVVTEEVSWESPDSAVVVVSQGEVTAKAIGSAQVFAVAAGIRAPVKVVVKAPDVETLEVAGPLALKVKGSETTRIGAVAKDAAGEVVASAVFAYESVDPKVATVDAEGVVTPVARGKTTINVTSGAKASVVEVVVK